MHKVHVIRDYEQYWLIIVIVYENDAFLNVVKSGLEIMITNHTTIKLATISNHNSRVISFLVGSFMVNLIVEGIDR